MSFTLKDFIRKCSNLCPVMADYRGVAFGNENRRRHRAAGVCDTHYESEIQIKCGIWGKTVDGFGGLKELSVFSHC